MDQQLQTALTKILRPTNDAYFEAHYELWPDWASGQAPQHWQPLVFDYPHLKVIGAAHSNSVTSPILNSIKAQVEHYLADDTIPSNQKLVMIEGYVTPIIPHYKNIEQAIQYMGESGMTAYLTMQTDIPLASPEVEVDRTAQAAVTQKLLTRFTAEQCVLFDLMDSLTSLIRKQELTVNRISNLIIHYAHQYNSTWQDNPPNQQLDLLSQINQMIIFYLGQPLWEINGQEVTLLLEEEMITRLTDNTIFKDDDHPYADYLNDIARLQDAARDDYLVMALYYAAQHHKHPLLVFGGSHILAIKPALDYLFS